MEKTIKIIIVLQLPCVVNGIITKLENCPNGLYMMMRNPLRSCRFVSATALNLLSNSSYYTSVAKHRFSTVVFYCSTQFSI